MTSPESQQPIPFEQTADGRRVTEFIAKHAADLEVTDADVELIKELFRRKLLKNHADITMRAGPMAKRYNLPFTEALARVVDKNTKGVPVYLRWQNHGTPMPTTFEETYDGKHILDFFKRFSAQYGLTAEDEQHILSLYKTGVLRRYEQVTAMARSRFIKTDVSLMDAVNQVAAEAIQKQEQERLKVAETPVINSTPLPSSTEPVIDQYEGLNELLQHLGWRREVVGSRAGEQDQRDLNYRNAIDPKSE